MLLTASGLAASVLAASLVSTGGERGASPEIEPPDAGQFDRFTEIDVEVRNVQRLQATITPIPGQQDSSEGGIADEGGVAQGCGTVVTHSDQQFQGQNVPTVLQAGFVETEIAAATFTVPPDQFPLILDLAEMLFATKNTNVTTTTEWSLMVWEGTPATGTLIEVFSSDDIILPHLVMPPGTQGTLVQVSVDPGDPDQIVIQNNGSNSFSIGFRIDKHNNPPTSSCFFGCIPSYCCPPAENSNAFPTTDATTYPGGPPNNPSQNWLFARDCAGSFCTAPPGWYSFTQLASLGYQPSGAWNIRASYTPANVQPVTGACCLLAGGCQVMTNCECENIDGTFVGAGTTCAAAGCPTPGACCIPGQPCSTGWFAEDCEAVNGVFAGPGSSCATNPCAGGACCVPSTGQCVGGVFAGDCEAANGIFHGIGSSCGVVVCFPEGACCMPDGSCVGPVTPEDCSAAGGNFQGNDTQCGTVSCPQPTGACCLPNGNCIVQNSANCAGFGGEWKGMGTNCNDTTGSGTADACEDPAPQCPADLTGSGAVNVFDLLELLAQWGPCADCNNCPADLTGSCAVNVFDLLELLAQWGPCP